MSIERISSPSSLMKSGASLRMCIRLAKPAPASSIAKRAPVLPQGAQAARQVRVVVDLDLLGQLDDHALGVDALERLRHAPRGERRRARVERQQRARPAARRCAPAPASTIATSRSTPRPTRWACAITASGRLEPQAEKRTSASAASSEPPSSSKIGWNTSEKSRVCTSCSIHACTAALAGADRVEHVGHEAPGDDSASAAVPPASPVPRRSATPSWPRPAADSLAQAGGHGGEVTRGSHHARSRTRPGRRAASLRGRRTRAGCASSR